MTSPILNTPEGRRLGNTITKMQQEIDTLKAGLRATQLGESTLYGTMYLKDVEGNLTGSIGAQADGSTGVVVTAGPAPPAPSLPILTPLMSGIDIAWDGTFTGGAARPLNFSYMRVHLSSDGPDFAPTDANHIGTLSDPGSFPAAPLQSGSQWWARFVAVNDSVPPVESPPSAAAGPAVPQQVVAQDVLDGIVTEVKLANDAVTAAKIAAGAVGTGEIAGQAVTLSNLANGSVDATKLTTGAVTTPKIAANAITANELAANSVIAGKLAADSVTTTSLVAGSVQANKIAAGAVLAEKIAADAVTAEKIAALAVTADAIAANAINAGHITAGAVTASKLAATLVLGTTIIAGTSTTGARVQLNSNGIEAFRASGMKVLDFDNASGDMTIAGRYRSADSGSRVEINPTGTAADEIRFYQGTAYAYINAETAPNSTAAVIGRSQTVNSRRGSFGCYPSEGFIALQSSTGTTLSAASCVDGATNIWANGNISLDARVTAGRVDMLNTAIGNTMRLEYRRASANNEPQLYAAIKNVGLTFTNGGALYVGDGAGNPRDIVANNVLASSSRRIKKREKAIELAVGSGREGLRRVESKQWLYDHELAPDDPTPPRQKIKRRDARRDDAGRPVVDDAGQPVFDDVEIEQLTPPVRKPHFFPVAEDLLAVLPELVTEDPTVPGGLGVGLRDAIGFLWHVNREQDDELVALRAEVELLKRRK